MGGGQGLQSHDGADVAAHRPAAGDQADVPALANYFIAMFKETPLLSAITVLELMNHARSIANYNYRYIEPITMVGAFFLVISLVSVVAIRLMQRHWGRLSRFGSARPETVRPS